MNQNIRNSQFIFTYGPGAIIEGQQGPRIIPDPEIGLFYKNSRFLPENFRIDDDRMSQGLLGGSSIFRLPSNAEAQLDQNQIIYRTKPFPQWKLCLNENSHGVHGPYILYLKDQCPVCGSAADRTDREAIRFVVACSAGHLDEVNWDYLVHGKNQCTRTELGSLPRNLQDNYSFYWNRRGGTLSSIEIRCPRCTLQPANFGNAYYRPLPCSRRRPESEGFSEIPRRSRGCDREARIIQRQAANLRIAQPRTLLSIKQTYTKLHTILQNPAIKIGIGMYEKISNGEVSSLQKLKEILDQLVSQNMLPQSVAKEILQSPWVELEQALKDNKTPPPTTYNGLILEEFKELIKGSVDGAPPARSARPKSEIIFEMNPNLRKTFDGPQGSDFLVASVNRLRTVTVQTGYIREIREENNPRLPDVITTEFKDMHGHGWYPGVEFLGEGLFIRMNDNDGWRDSPKGEAAQKWNDAFSKSQDYVEFVFRDGKNSRDELEPTFVWWHTLSHLLVRAIGEDSGYSSAAIRERIYFERNGTKVRGGIILYATQPGSEGTLGGLIALAPFFDRFLRMAFDQLETCSGDPLCMGQKFEVGGYNGPACYGCLMNSETSCEHRNMWLDRQVLQQNMP